MKTHPERSMYRRYLPAILPFLFVACLPRPALALSVIDDRFPGEGTTTPHRTDDRANRMTPGSPPIELAPGSPNPDRYGFSFEGTSNSREGADFTFTSTGADLSLDLRAFDIDTSTEVAVLLNGTRIAHLPRTSNNATAAARVDLPLGSQIAGINILSFVQTRPGWRWGITELLLSPVAPPAPDSQPRLQVDTLDPVKYGFRFDGVRSHRERAEFTFTSAGTDLSLDLLGFDVDNGTEVAVLLNGTRIAYLPRTPNDATAAARIELPLGSQIAGTNTLSFVQARPGWRWGITGLLLSPVAPPAPDSTPRLQVDTLDPVTYGFRYDGVRRHRERADFTFTSADADLSLDLRAFDVDTSTEVAVLLNGTRIAYLPRTPNNATAAARVDLPLGSQIAGTNTLRFVQARPGWRWGITDLLLTRTTPPETNEPPVVVAGPDIDLADYERIFNDDFDSGSLDPDNWATGLLWGPYHRINNEQQFYVDTLGMHAGFDGYTPFSFTSDTLKITATPTDGTVQPPAKPAVPTSRPSFPSTWRPYRWAEYRYADEELNDNGSLKTEGYDPANVDFLSGILSSYGTLKMTHGYVEMRAKVPEGDGLWPAFWLLNAHYVEDSPEIDVMEFLGDDVNTLYNTYHYFDTSDGWRKISSPSFRNDNPDWTRDFHTFGLSWTPEKLIWYVDGVKTHEVREGELVPDPNNRYPAGTRYRISGQAMYLLANLAVGGNWPGPADKAIGPKSFEIDYIRAYKKKLPALSFDADGEFVPGSAFQQRFGDEFDGTTLDADTWDSRFIWGPYLVINGETQYYVDALGADAGVGYSPFSVGGGTLKITARDVDDPAHGGWAPPVQKPDADDPVYDTFDFRSDGDYSPRGHTSGILTSYDAFKFAHGYAEVRAKVPAGQGLWPAFWLLNGYYVAQQPEIDIMEIIGNRPDLAYHTYHRKDDDGTQKPQEQATSIHGSPEIGYADGFHTFGVHWEHDRITWYVDGVQAHTYSDPDVGYQIMYVLLNLAVGGNFNQFEVPLAGDLPATFEIDHVRVYQVADPD